LLFNSLHYLIFFPIVVAVFFMLKTLRHRQLFLLSASVYFYAVWKPEYVVLLFISAFTDYILAKKIEESDNLRNKRIFLILSLLINFGLLFSFKYFTFFDHNVHRFLANFNLFYHSQIDDILLPVGISFYTFQTVSYTIDVYRKRMKAERNFYKFALFVSFFPQLVAGPIERATDLLHQFERKTSWDYVRITHGLKLMFWGFFQKVVIADSMSLLVNHVYSHPTDYYNIEVLTVTLFFAVQIYCDFSGYTDIARGTAKIMGYDLQRNFRSPYFAPSFNKFWERWHISLSTWFRDYVYIPLGGSRVSKARHALNITITFVLSGFWHGAGWTYLIWGGLHAIFYLTEYHASKFYKLDISKLWIRFLKTAVVFIFINFAWIFFRSKSVTIATILITNTLDFSHFQFNFDHLTLFRNFSLIIFLFFVHVIERHKDIVSYVSSKPIVTRWFIYYCMAIGFLFLGNFDLQQFIYFQF